MQDLTLQKRWETDQDSFKKLSRAEFDLLQREGQFTTGPFLCEPSKFMKEFGPYNPYRWAFGELADGRLVCCDTFISEKLQE